jgi:hypothetical protein
MHRLGATLVLATCACDIDLLSARSADVYDDGAHVTIVGCDSPNLFCSDSSPLSMTATLDGTPLAIPASTTAPIVGDESVFLATFAATFDEPVDRRVAVALGPDVGTVALSAPFAVEVPTTPVSRAAGAVTITYPYVDGAKVSVWYSTTCGTAGTEGMHPYLHDDLVGTLSLDLTSVLLPQGGEPLPCTVRLTLDQAGPTTVYDAGAHRLATTAHAVSIASFATTP